MKRKFIKNENLKTEANKIFNGLIDEAYIEFKDESDVSFGEYHKDDNSRREKYFSNMDVEKQHELRYDAENIVFKFTNGAIVEFSNSEWAAMDKLETV